MVKPPNRPRIRSLHSAVAGVTAVFGCVACTASVEQNAAPQIELPDVVESPPWVEGELPQLDSTVTFSLPEEWELVDGEDGPSEPGGLLEQEWQLSAAGDDANSVEPLSLTVRMEHIFDLAKDDKWPRASGSWRKEFFHGLDAYVDETPQRSRRLASRLVVRLGNWDVDLVLLAPEEVDGAEFLKTVVQRVDFKPTVPADEAELSVLGPDTDLSRVCEGEHFANAARYTGDGPHPTQIFRRGSTKDGWDDRLHPASWHEELSSEWWPGEADPGDIQLVACADSVERETTMTETACPYIVSHGSHNLKEGTQFMASLEVIAEPVTLYEVATGSVVAEATVRSEATCPPSAHIDPSTDEPPETVHHNFGVAEYIAPVRPHVFD
ncbi:hypothetical protein CDO52_26815 [Nocardiopsis gilva YIM 90087]|uniref:Uncharacterized protein n=1 Tax=Nocardiopsis gilva YIM 90087 TaxID=1235441 RepID=A0A223SCU5_9ACTN|nr:hypothetical protein CDO52_26815 [Nocardiopsis gilva YIM 90087]